MSIVIPPGYGQVSFDGIMPGTGRPWTVTQGFAHEYTNANQCASDAGEIWAASFLGMQIDELQFTGTRVYLGNDGAPLVGSSNTGAGNGAASGEPYASNACVLIKRVTALGGRANRGRMYVPGVREAGVADGANLVGTDLTNWGTVTIDYALGWFEATRDPDHLFTAPVILHDELVGGLPTPIVEFQLQSLLATQRRRLRK